MGKASRPTIRSSRTSGNRIMPIWSASMESMAMIFSWLLLRPKPPFPAAMLFSIRHYPFLFHQYITQSPVLQFLRQGIWENRRISMKITTFDLNQNKDLCRRAKALYLTAFPKEERLPWWILRLNARRKGIDLTAFVAEGEFLGFTSSVTVDELQNRKR